MIERLQVTIEPMWYKAIYGEDKHDIRMIKMEVRKNGQVFHSQQVYREDEMRSFFDCIFEDAKYAIKKEIERWESGANKQKTSK